MAIYMVQISYNDPYYTLGGKYYTVCPNGLIYIDTFACGDYSSIYYHVLEAYIKEELTSHNTVVICTPLEFDDIQTGFIEIVHPTIHS